MPAVTRIGDADVLHCSVPDVNTAHLLPGSPCPTHAKAISSGSSTVKVNSKGCGRVGDGITACTSVAAGSSNVFAG